MLVALLALVLVPAGLAARTSASSMEALDSGVLAELNAIRAQHGLVPLRLDAELGAAALAHSEQMAADGYFHHDSDGGAPFWTRLRAYESGSTSGYWSVGENLLWSSPGVDPSRALQMWMASPDHRRNILTARWRDVGVAAVHVESAPGFYGGRPVTIITTDFGVRR